MGFESISIYFIFLIVSLESFVLDQYNLDRFGLLLFLNSVNFGDFSDFALASVMVIRQLHSMKRTLNHHMRHKIKKRFARRQASRSVKKVAGA